jgi:hypothetical protein
MLRLTCQKAAAAITYTIITPAMMVRTSMAAVIPAINVAPCTTILLVWSRSQAAQPAAV